MCYTSSILQRKAKILQKYPPHLLMSLSPLLFSFANFILLTHTQHTWPQDFSLLRSYTLNSSHKIFIELLGSSTYFLLVYFIFQPIRGHFPAHAKWSGSSYFMNLRNYSIFSLALLSSPDIYICVLLAASSDWNEKSNRPKENMYHNQVGLFTHRWIIKKAKYTEE